MQWKRELPPFSAFGQSATYKLATMNTNRDTDTHVQPLFVGSLPARKEHTLPNLDRCVCVCVLGDGVVPVCLETVCVCLMCVKKGRGRGGRIRYYGGPDGHGYMSTCVSLCVFPQHAIQEKAQSR